MKTYNSTHQFVLQKVKKIKKLINTKSKFSRFPSENLINELLLFDYLRIEAGEKTDIIDFEE